MTRRMLGADQFHRTAVAVELLEGVGPQTVDFDEHRIEHQGVVDGREDEAVQVGSLRTVVFRTRETVRIVPSRHAGERTRNLGPLARPEIHHLQIERRQDLGRRTGLAQVAAVVLERMVQNPPPHGPGNTMHIVNPVSIHRLAQIPRYQIGRRLEATGRGLRNGCRFPRSSSRKERIEDSSLRSPVSSLPTC